MSKNNFLGRLTVVFCLPVLILLASCKTTGVINDNGENQTPVADAGPDKNVNTGSLVTLDGSGSSDADGDTLTYTWSFVSKPRGSVAALSDSNVVTPTFTADIDGTYRIKLIVSDGKTYSTDTVTIFSSYDWDEVLVESAIVDDYNGVSLIGRKWYYSRIGTDRGEMGGGSYSVGIGGGQASATVKNGWAGVWTSLKYNAAVKKALNPTRLLGPYVRSLYQPEIIGVEFDIINGSGQFKVELKDLKRKLVDQEKFKLSGGKRKLQFYTSPETEIKELNWLVDGKGHATVDEVRFIIDSPYYTMPQAVFLFSYGHLSQCYDSASGLVRDRARWPVEDFASVQTIGTFALATAVAWDLGYIEKSTARNILKKTRDSLLSLPRYHGLLPHFITDGDITENTEWSSIDTVIALISEILACQAVGEDTSVLETMMRNIDWEDLSNNGEKSISMGYSYQGEKLESRWDTFGSEAFLVALAYAAATGSSDAKLDEFCSPPTWDGSGFNDELAALFFPMNGTDHWGNDWYTFRREASRKQLEYFDNHMYKDYNLFGLSACEVPEPWAVKENQVYMAWGVGGHNEEANDGTSIVGYPIIASHYAAMIAAEHPGAFEDLFSYLIENRKIFTPLNNVESFGIDNSGDIRWNSLKGSWDLSLQLLGVSRLLSKGKYLPYSALENNSFLKQGFDMVMDEN